MIMMRVSSVVVVSLPLHHVELLKLVPCKHLVKLGLLHGGLLRFGVLVLGVLGGVEGGASSFPLSTSVLSVLSLDYTLSNFFLYTFTGIFLDSACVFLMAARVAFPAC
jgi:hypothetical protein